MAVEITQRYLPNQPPRNTSDEVRSYLNDELDRISTSLNDVVERLDNLTFGANYQYSFSEEVSQTTSENFQNKVTMTTNPLPIGSYRITAHAEITNDNGKAVIVKVVLDTINTNEFHYVPKFANDEYFAFQSFALVNFLSEQPHVLEIDFASTSEGGTAKIRRARLEIFRVGDF